MHDCTEEDAGNERDETNMWQQGLLKYHIKVTPRLCDIHIIRVIMYYSSLHNYRLHACPQIIGVTLTLMVVTILTMIINFIARERSPRIALWEERQPAQVGGGHRKDDLAVSKSLVGCART